MCVRVVCVRTLRAYTRVIGYPRGVRRQRGALVTAERVFLLPGNPIATTAHTYVV